ncbi:MAG: hypothetical protein H0S85_01790 [Desulfovibrionaceae bacterium]|jgi:hypothetical protein|nr:hypothetical protein [Desulfovibrionaceae bacterium]
MTTSTNRRSTAKRRSVIFGIASVALYAAVFTNSDTVLDVCSRGGFYNVLPIATVLLFSYVHGSFASNVWSALGIEASSRAGKAKRKETPARPEQRVREQAVVAR